MIHSWSWMKNKKYLNQMIQINFVNKISVVFEYGIVLLKYMSGKQPIDTTGGPMANRKTNKEQEAVRLLLYKRATMLSGLNLQNSL